MLWMMVSQSQRFWGLTALSFLVVGFLVYGHSLDQPFTSWDDRLLITENPIVQGQTSNAVVAAFTSYDPELYIPLTFLSYSLNHALCADASLCYHATDLFLHVANALLVALLLAILCGSRRMGIVLGLLFLLHPLNTEAVAWASARKDTLSAFFFLTSFLLYCRSRMSPDRRVLVLFFSFIALLLALLSKVVAAMLPLIFLLLDLLEQRRDYRGLIVEKIPFFLLSIAFIVVAFFGKADIVVATTFFQKLWMGTWSSLFYIWKFFLPTDLSVMYPFTGRIALFSWPFVVTVPLVTALLLLALYVGWRHRWVLFGVGWYVLMLAPTFFNIAKGGEVYFASDRYAYLPMIGLLFLLGFGVQRLESVRNLRWRLKPTGMVVASVILLVVCGILSARQSAVWNGSVALYERVLSLYPRAPAALNNLGMEYYYARDIDRAMPLIEQAYAERPDPRFLVNRGILRMALGDDDGAESDFRTAMTELPSFTDGQYQMGLLEQRRGRLDEATEWYRAVLSVHPENRSALNNLGAVYLQQSKWPEAAEVFTKIVELYPEFPEALYNLAGAYEQMGSKAQAEEMYRRALALQPQDPDAMVGLARLRYADNDIDAAAQYLMKALSLDPSSQSAADLVLRMKRDGVAE